MMVDQPKFKQVVTEVFENQTSMPRAVDSSVNGNGPYEPTLTSASQDVLSVNGEDIPIIIHRILLIYLCLDNSILLVRF